jgi:hypothetical protein
MGAIIAQQEAAGHNGGGIFINRAVQPREPLGGQGS